MEEGREHWFSIAAEAFAADEELGETDAGTPMLSAPTVTTMSLASTLDS